MFIICKTVHENAIWHGIGIGSVTGLGLAPPRPHAYRPANAMIHPTQLEFTLSIHIFADYHMQFLCLI